jgi:hypothetical protein
MAAKKGYPNAILQALPSADFNSIAMDLKLVELVKRTQPISRRTAPRIPISH